MEAHVSGGGGGGSLASHGTGERDKQALRVRNVPGAFLEEVVHEICGSYEATVWRKLEDGTGKAYAWALYKFLRDIRVRGFLSPRRSRGACYRWPQMASMSRLSRPYCPDYA